MRACCRVGIEMSRVEVRFEDLRIDADVFVGGRAMPTVLNSVRNFVEVRSRLFCLRCPRSAACRDRLLQYLLLAICLRHARCLPLSFSRKNPLCSMPAMLVWNNP